MKNLVKNQLFVLIIAVLTLVLFERTVPVVTLTDRAIVVAVGIDKEEDKFVLSAQIVRPSRNDGSKGSTAYSVIKGKGNSLSQAISEVSRNCSLNASLAHCNLVVIGEYLKEKGEYPNFENLASSYGLPYEARVVIAEKKASEIVEYLCLYEISGITFTDYLKSDRISAEQFTSSVKQLLYDSTLEGAYTRLLSVALLGEDVSYVEKPETTWIEGLKMKSCYLIKYGESAVSLDEEQTKTVNMVLEKPKRGNVLITVSDTKVDLLLEGASSKLSYKFEGGKPILTIKTKIEVKADEFDNKRRDLTLTEEDFFDALLEEVKKEVASDYVRSLKNVIDYLTEEGVDLFEIYEGFDRFERKKWRKIASKENYLSLVEYKIEAEVVVIGVE